MPEEVPMLDDIRNWVQNATTEQREFVKNLMLFFVQADIEVNNTYIDEYLPWYYKELPIKNMLVSFAGREGVHTLAYAYIVETLALPSETFSAFKDDPVLLKIHDTLRKYRMTQGTKQRYQCMVATSMLGEGTMLFGLFAMLLNFQRLNLFNGLCTIVAWSIRDEDFHVQNIAKLIKIDPAFAEHDQATRWEWFDEVYNELFPLIRQFTINCFKHEADNEVSGLHLDDVLKFLDFQVARRIRQANINENFTVPENPFPWFDQIIGGVEDANFFERRRTEYSKNNLVGDWAYP